MATEININPNMLTWAIARAGYVLAEEIAENLAAALANFKTIVGSL